MKKGFHPGFYLVCELKPLAIPRFALFSVPGDEYIYPHVPGNMGCFSYPPIPLLLSGG